MAAVLVESGSVPRAAGCSWGRLMHQAAVRRPSLMSDLRASHGREPLRRDATPIVT